MLAPKLIVVTILLVPLSSSLAQSSFPDRCPNQKPLPFAAIEKKQAIDSICGLKGSSASSPSSQLQNSVKNNFCAEPGAGGKPESFTPQMLVDLQKNTKITSGHGKDPSSRDALKTLGEGKVVRIKAYLIEAHHADVGTGESVNCGGKPEDQNDVHIALGSQASSKECESVTAEISPHYRPDSWNEIGHFETFDTATKKYIPKPGMAARLQAHPYRITGQLLFDASHTLCPCGTACSGNPIRASLWEIHPIYDIEVCIKASTQCNENSDADWIAFDTWRKSWLPIQPVPRPPPHRVAAR